jgi:acetyl esterase/lipase
MEGVGNSAFVFAHGGAGTMLSAEESIFECYRYAVDFNCVVFSVDYRKGPETKCPNQQ